MDTHCKIISHKNTHNARHCGQPFDLGLTLPHTVSVQQCNRIGKADLQKVIKQHQKIDQTKKLRRLQAAPARDIKRNTLCEPCQLYQKHRRQLVKHHPEHKAAADRKHI